MSKAVLILNLGTPAKPTTEATRAFHRKFFSDPFVFDMPAWGRWMLRNLIILPFRSPKTAEKYQEIWMDEGSPLQVYTDRLLLSLQNEFKNQEVHVSVAMAYSEPSIEETMESLKQSGITDIVVLPLFPQYSTATTASLFYGVQQSLTSWSEQPTVTFIQDFFNHPAFIQAWVSLISENLATLSKSAPIDHVVFSYHGLPTSNIEKADQFQYCKFNECCNQLNDKNKQCYRAQCIATTQLITEQLNWESDFYSVAFQSRFGKTPWIQPYLDEHLVQLAQNGSKNIAVVTPSFVSDCLETTHEIGIEYNELYLEKGGNALHLIPNLNDNALWFDAVKQIVNEKL